MDTHIDKLQLGDKVMAHVTTHGLQDARRAFGGTIKIVSRDKSGRQYTIPTRHHREFPIAYRMMKRSTVSSSVSASWSNLAGSEATAGDCMHAVERKEKHNPVAAIFPYQVDKMKSDKQDNGKEILGAQSFGPGRPHMELVIMKKDD